MVLLLTKIWCTTGNYKWQEMDRFLCNWYPLSPNLSIHPSVHLHSGPVVWLLCLWRTVLGCALCRWERLMPNIRGTGEKLLQSLLSFSAVLVVVCCPTIQYEHNLNMLYIVFQFITANSELAGRREEVWTKLNRHEESSKGRRINKAPVPFCYISIQVMRRASTFLSYTRRCCCKSRGRTSP